MKILVVKPDHLGDFAVALPVLHELVQRFGRENIRVLVFPANAAWQGLLPWLPRLDPVFHPRYAREKTGLLPELWRSCRFARGLRAEGFSHGVELTASRHDPWGKLWLALAGARQRIGLAGKYDFLLGAPLGLGSGHQTRRLAQRFPAAWGITGTTPPSAFIHTEFRHRIPAKGLVPREVLVAPFAGQPAKEWPEARWLNLIGKLRKEGREVTILAGPDRAADGRRLLARTGFPPEALFIPDSIGATLRRIARAKAVVALDTAISHYAWLTGTPAVELFAGTADPERWGALDASLIRAEPPPPCAPCRRAACNQPVHFCMEEISAERAEAAVERLAPAPRE